MKVPDGFFEDYPEMWSAQLEIKYGLTKSQVKSIANTFRLKKAQWLLESRASMGGLKASDRREEDTTGYRQISTGNLVKKQGNVTRHRIGIR